MINTEPYTPSSIGNINFRIPLYQRPYAWDKLQVEQLLNDLFHAYEVDEKSQNEKSGKYYIGILSIGKVPNNSNLYDLIDGQQRITTLILIGKALAKYHSDWNIFFKNRLDIYGREADKKYLSDGCELDGLNRKMVETFKCTNEFIKKKCEDKGDFAKYVYENAAFFLTIMPDNYSIIEKNLHFVRMNNRGKQLEKHDILKTRLASLITDPLKRSEFVMDWNKFAQLGCSEENSNTNDLNRLSKLEDILNDSSNETQPSESEIFYESIVSYPEFLLIALDRFDEFKNKVSYSNKDNLLSEFGIDSGDKYFKWEYSNVLLFHEVLKKQFELFDKFIIKRDKKEGYKFKASETNFNDSTKNLEMFQAFQYVSREPYSWLKEAFDYLKDEPTQIDSNKFLAELKKNDNDYRKNDSVLLTYGNDGIRYWFWRLDYYLWENKDTYFKDDKSIDVAKNYIFRANRSIEHVAPQSPKSNSNITFDDIQRNSFGNLVMISSGQNSSLQNESYVVKMAHVDSFINKAVNGSIESLKLLCIKNETGWNQESVINHGNKMIEILIKSFPLSCDEGGESDYSEITKNLENQKLPDFSKV